MSTFAISSPRAGRAGAFLILLLQFLWPVHASAAEITTVSQRGQNAEVGADAAECNLVLDGAIEDGDAAKMAALLRGGLRLDTGDGFDRLAVLCLHSDGGSFSEAMEIVRLMKSDDRAFDVGTMIRQRDRCTGACGLVFMGGRYNAFEVGDFSWRYMHREARLGFSAPPLDGTDALEVVRAILDTLVLATDFDGARWMQPSLLAQMLATPPSGTLEIEEVDQIGRWNIGLVPSVAFDFETLDVTAGCRNLLSWDRDESANESPISGGKDGLVIERTTARFDDSEGYRVTQMGMWEVGCPVDNGGADMDERPCVYATPFCDLGDLRRQVVLGHTFLDHTTRLRDIGR